MICYTILQIYDKKIILNKYLNFQKNSVCAVGQS